MSRIRLTLGRRWLLGLLCAVSLAVAIAGILTTTPVYAANAPEIVLMQGSETSVPLDLPDDSYGELVVEGLPAGVIADLQPASPETEPILKITASPETNPGDRLFTITDSVYQTPVVTGLLKIRPGMIVDLMPMDVRDNGTVKHALILKHLDGQPLDIPLQAHLAATAPLQFSLDGQTFLSEGDITFNNGTCQLFLTGAGQLTLTSKEFGLGATLDIAGTIPTIEKTIISTESTVVDTENTTGSNIRTYDLANDWSTTNNPNEAWSYGYKTTKTSEFTLYDKTRFTLGDITLWYSLATVDNSPSTWKNTSSTSHYGVAPGEVTIHPGPNGEYCVIRWTSPVNGTIAIGGYFGAGDRGAMSYYIYKNNSSLWERTAQTDTQYFSLPLDVAVGDVIDFMVGDYYYFGNTPLHVTITTPETDPLLLATLGRQPWCHFFGDPVNVVNGNYTYDQTDLSIPTPGKPLQFTRFYNSRDTYAGPLGKGWQHNYNTFLTPNQDNSIAVYYPDGHTFVFTPGGEGYTRPPGCFETLDKNPDGTFTLTFKDQTKYLYNAEGKLTRILDKNNNAITLQYDNTLLTAVTEPAGRSLQFTYDPDNHLTQITDPAGRTIVFTYENGNLATVQDLNGGITTYTYTSAGLAAITDPNGHTVVANTYDHQSRVIEQTDGKSNRTIFAYDPDNRKTTITDARGNTTTFYYDEKFRVTTIEHPDGTTNAYTYDDNHNQTSETDQNGHTTTYTYDPMGNLLSRTAPAPLNYTTNYTYDNCNNPTSITDAAGYVTNLTYDTRGNLLTLSKEIAGVTAVTSFTYDETGQVTSITNANGKVTRISYDQYGNRASVTDPLNRTTTYTYDIIGRKLSETDARGATTTYTYDPHGNILTVTDALGKTAVNTYDANHNRTSTTDKRGHTTRFTYDANNQVTSITDALGNTTTYTYDAGGNLIAITDAAGHTTSYTYDSLDRLISITDPTGNTTTYTLDGNGNLVAKTDRNGHTTSYSYDVLNRLTRVTDPSGAVTITEYDPSGNKTGVTDAKGHTTRFTYDQASRLLSITDALNHTTTYTYDLVGNRLSSQDARGATWTYTYDDANRLIATTDALGHTSRVQYDTADNVISHTDKNDIATKFSYDLLNRLISVTDALGNTTTYDYDENGNLVKVTDANGNSTTYAYDALNRQVQVTDALGNTRSQTYDPAGNLSARTKPDGNTITYSYDANHRLTAISYPDSSKVTYTYDAEGNRTSMTDTNGTTSYAYDDLDRLTAVTRNGNTAGYEYDVNGNITGLTYPDGLKVNYTFNELNLPVSVSDSVYSTTIAYDENGNPSQEVLPNGITVNYGYDLNGRLVLVEHVKEGETEPAAQEKGKKTKPSKDKEIIAQFAYTLDNVGNRTSVTDEKGKVTRYQYDALYQLSTADYSHGKTDKYTYDAVGNRLRNNHEDYVYDAANRLIQVKKTPYRYDPNGNLISAGDKTQYEYDCEDRLIKFTDGKMTIQYTYDGDGNRTSQLVSQESTKHKKGKDKDDDDDCDQRTVSGTVYEYREYIYAINTGIPLLLVEKDEKGNSYNYLYSDRLLSRTGPQGSIYYHQDGLGSTTALSDISGKILNRYEYDAFGQPRSLHGKIDNQILFAGEMYDPSGLIYLRARYYDPGIGRFLTEDTLFGELDDPLSQNLYLYCANNPVVYVDPTGHMKVCQYDDMARGVVTSLGDTVRDLLAIPDVLAEFIEAISSGKISMKDLGQALGSSFAPVKHLAASSGRIWLGDPTDKEVYEYGRNMGATLQMIAGGGAAGAAAIKVISNAAPKLGKALARVAGASREVAEAKSSSVKILGRGSSGRVGARGLTKGTSKTVDANKLNHIFGKAQHNLDGFLEKYGGDQTKAFNALESATQKYVNSNNINGNFKDIIVNVDGIDITVRGTVINGQVKIGTAFIP